MKKLMSIALFALSFQLLANCEIITSEEYSYLKEDMNKGTICREFMLELNSKVQQTEVQSVKIIVNDVEKFRVGYHFEAVTSLGELTGAGTHFWYPGDSFAKIDIQ